MTREQLESSSKERTCTELKKDENARARAEREQNERIVARSEKSKRDKEGSEDGGGRLERRDQTTKRRSKTNICRKQGGHKLENKVTW